MEKLSEVKTQYYKPEITVDAVLWKLAGGDASKVPTIENLDVSLAYDWYYTTLVQELNEMRYRIAETKQLRIKN